MIAHLRDVKCPDALLQIQSLNMMILTMSSFSQSEICLIVISTICIKETIVYFMNDDFYFSTLFSYHSLHILSLH